MENLYLFQNKDCLHGKQKALKIDEILLKTTSKKKTKYIETKTQRSGNSDNEKIQRIRH